MRTQSMMMKLPALLRSFSSALLLGGWAALAACGAADVGSSGQAVGAVAGELCALNSDCETGLECEHGTCQPHKGGGGAEDADGGEAEPGDDNGVDNPAPTCLVDSDCASGQECDDGACKSHG